MPPLDNIRICDLTRILAGPYATMRLGDMGADVIKIENPKGGDDTRAWGPPFISGQSAYHLAVNRSKRSLALDLKRGASVLERLIPTCDVLIENFRPGTLEKLGFPYARLQELNPRLIYCSISGYGQLGKARKDASYDVIVQGESGLQDITGLPEGSPTRIGVSIADLVAGQNAVEGILLALLQRARTGRGDRVDIALYDGVLALLTYHAQGALSAGIEPQRMGNAHPSLVPYQAFQAEDQVFNIGVGSEDLWHRFCAIIERPELFSDPRFSSNADRVRHRQQLLEIIEPIIKSQRADQWLQKCRDAGIPAGPIRSVRAALEEARQADRGMITSVQHEQIGPLEMLGHPIKLLSQGMSPQYAPPPPLGAHSQEVLLELGYSQEQINELAGQDIIKK